jgi:DNA-directed RNA polymerase specialized sigma24 family protein
MEPEASVSQWILGAREGDSRAIGELWQRYFGRLVFLARQKLASAPRRVRDEEDLALSAFASFCKAVEQGRLPDLVDRHDLWKLLITMTAQKAVDELRREGRQKRGCGRVKGESQIVPGTGSSSFGGLDLGDTPSPEFAAIVAEECDRLLGRLNDDLRAVALAKMEGFTNQEIARRLDCSVSTVERSLRLIRKIWLRPES